MTDYGIELQAIGKDGRIRRSDLFALSDAADADDESLLSFLWHVLAWGTGTSARNNRRRIGSCREHVETLRHAFAAARHGEPREAYESLIRRGGAVVPWFGPAFFTKFLYFASESAEPRSLILDARVACSLYRLGWNMAPTYPTPTFSYNWYTDTYASYCELLRDWSNQANGKAEAHHLTPDMFERALFDGVAESDGSTRRK